MTGEMIGNVLVGATVLALGAAIYLGTGGRAWFGTHEKPDRIVGRRVQFLNVDWLGASPPALPTGIVEEYQHPSYRIVLDAAFENEGKCERFVKVAARSKGWPASGAAKRPTAVLATFESGKGFWADLNVIG